jgi:tetratricopeptide (TPR) repeat protein
MKKVIFLLACVFSLGTAFGQSNKVQTAINWIKPEYMELDKAKQAIDEAAVHPKTSAEAKTWFVRGQVYYKLYQTKDERYKGLDKNPLKESYISFAKAKQLDEGKRYEDQLLFQLTQIRADFFNKGGAEYEAKKFAQSMESFETVIAIGKLPYINNLDTGSFYNTALAAEGAATSSTNKDTANKYFAKAVDYYNKSIELNWGGPDVFHYLATIFLKQGDSTAALKSYQAGIAKYPKQTANLYIALINFYLAKKDINTSFDYMAKALELDSLNSSLWQVYGNALEKRNDRTKAIEAFKKMISIDSTNFMGYYNVGSVYFNMGVEENDKANAVPFPYKTPDDETKFNAFLKSADDKFHLALPFFEKAYDIKKDDSDLLIGLKQIYYRFKMNDKLADVQKQIDKLK